MNSGMHSEFQYYLDHQAELAERYAGKVLIIKDHGIVGIYDSDLEAVRKASEQYKPGTFLVQQCEAPGGNSTHQTFPSRVRFR